MTDLLVDVDDHRLAATWTDDNQMTRAAIAAALPLEVDAARWGDELYGTIPVETTPERTQRRVEPGTIAYWPDGPAICLFWGPTPASTDTTPVAASPVAVVATVTDYSPLASIDGGARLQIKTA